MTRRRVAIGGWRDAGIAAFAAVVLCVGLLATLVGVGSVARRGPLPDPPSFASVRTSHRPSDAVLLDRHGEPLHERRVDGTRRVLEWAPLDAVSPALVAAVVGAEDRRFFTHGGVDLLALAASARDRLAGRSRRGGSTITMQLAALLDAPAGSTRARRGPLEKLRQVRLAWRLERAWSKREILEAYLNRVGFRGEIAGVAAASRLLLAKAPDALAPGEAAVLAALVRAPNAGRGDLERRAQAIAARPGTAASAHEVRAALDRTLDAAEPHAPRASLAPHLAAHRLAPARGAAVSSTLDARVQRAAIAALDRSLRGLAGRNVRDGAVLVVDNASGDVLAWVGGSGRLASAAHVDAVLARRQAGSTLKPFLYALALEQHRLTAASPLDDTPIAFAVAGGAYRPRNYDEGHRGLVSARAALAGSLNVPAVRVLGLVGTDAFSALLRDLGFAGVDRRADHYGPALALGAAEVSLAELVNAFRALAAGGVLRPLRIDPTAEVDDGGRRVLSPAAAFVVADVLSDRESRAASFGLESPLATRFWSAVKTGTSKDMRDNWCVGFSPRHTVGVWVGNFSGEPMHDVSGVSGAAPAWLEIMSFLHDSGAPAPPRPPAGVQRRPVALAATGEPGRTEWFLDGTEPAAADPIAIAAPRPRIGAPLDGGVYAIDPDIPAARQRIALALAGAARPDGARWRLDGRDLGPASQTRLWPPAAGRHRLELIAASGRAIDAVAFEVKPAAPLRARPSSHRPPRSPAR